MFSLDMVLFETMVFAFSPTPNGPGDQVTSSEKVESSAADAWSGEVEEKLQMQRSQAVPGSSLCF